MTAKADGFSEHAWPYSTYVMSRTPHPGALENYLSTNYVTGSRETTLGAVVPSIAESFGHGSSAGAGLTSPTRVYLHQFTTGALSLVREHGEEGTPSSIVNRARVPASRQSTDIQILDRNKTEVRDQPATEFVLKVPPLISNFPLGLSQQDYRLPASVAPLLATGYFSLCPPQLGLLFDKVSGIVNLATVRQSGEAVQAHIDTDFAIPRRQGLSTALDREDGEPLADLALEGDGLDGSPDFSVQFNFDFPGTLDTELAIIQKPTAVAIRGEGDAVVSSTRLESGKARLLAPLAAGIERLEALVQPSQYVLAAGVVSQPDKTLGPHGLELVGLVVVVQADTAVLPSTAPFLQGAVVEVAGFPQLLTEELGLFLGWVQSVLEGDAQLFPLLRFDVFANRGFRNVTDRTGVVATRPQGRNSGAKLAELSPHITAGDPFEPIHNFRHGKTRVEGNKQVYVVRHNFHRLNLPLVFCRHLVEQLLQTFLHLSRENRPAVLRAPHEVNFEREHRPRVLVNPCPGHAKNYITDESISQGGAAIPLPAKAGSPLAA
jgi:hypothetical protein